MAAHLCPLSAADEQQTENTSPWTYELTLGAFLSNTSSDNSETSRDPLISDTDDSYAYRLTIDTNLTWQSDPHTVTQDLAARFGRSRDDGEAWAEDSDEIDYDASYSYALSEPHFMYAAWGADTQFTGPEPDEEPLDPFVALLSAGYGQRHTDFFPDTDELIIRGGIRAQKRWGRGLSDDERDLQVGPEARVRYQRSQFDERLEWYAQYDLFGDFADIEHWQHRFDAGLDLKLSAYLTVNLTLRGYYESEPDDADDDATGYDELSWKQESLVGLTYSL